MTDVLTRRILARRILAAGAATAVAIPTEQPARAVTVDAIEAIERDNGGRLGVFALDTGSGRVLAHRADERFLMESTFKLPLAAAVLHRFEQGRDRPDALVRYGTADLVEHSPVTRAHVASGALPVEVLCAATMLESDNAAANLLLRRIGGPAALTAAVRGLGDGTTRFDRYEPVDGWSGLEDTTSPHAIVGTTGKILLGPVLAPGSRARLVSWMEEYAFGRSRLRGLVPPSWRAGDRTGTGGGACNDIAILWPPGRAPILVAAFADLRHADEDRGDAMLRAAGAAVVTWAG